MLLGRPPASALYHSLVTLACPLSFDYLHTLLQERLGMLLELRVAQLLGPRLLRRFVNLDCGHGTADIPLLHNSWNWNIVFLALAVV